MTINCNSVKLRREVVLARARLEGVLFQVPLLVEYVQVASRELARDGGLAEARVQEVRDGGGHARVRVYQLRAHGFFDRLAEGDLVDGSVHR